LLDFARIIEVFEKHQVSFVSVTQQLNSTTSMGRLMLNVLLSFAQFEREIIAERTRDKIAAARRKGKWVGGMPLLGYDVDPCTFKLVVNAPEAARDAFQSLLETHCNTLPVISNATVILLQVCGSLIRALNWNCFCQRSEQSSVGNIPQL
jgi:site-specific DNA recombinase